jgi:hypothetical protein
MFSHLGLVSVIAVLAARPQRSPAASSRGHEWHPLRADQSAHVVNTAARVAVLPGQSLLPAGFSAPVPRPTITPPRPPC